ncbi:MAG: hypothetical protein ACTSVG_14015 [Alphaproteobacteria bacterium]
MRLTTVCGRAFVWLGLTLAINSVALADIGRPGRDAGPTKVEVKIFLLDVDDVDGASQSFEANVYYEQRWNDPRLAHEGIGERSRPLSDVWHPRIQLVNQQRAWKTFPDVVEIAPSGDVIYRQRLWGSFSQPLLLRDFPFDRQVFEILLAATGYTSEEVELVIDPKSRISERFSLPDWNVVGWKVESKIFQVVPGGENVAAITLSFEATRRAGYFIGKVIVPLLMIVAMSWVVFWIDPRESGTQVSVAITSILTLIAYRFAVGVSLPKVEYMTRLDLFILGSSILVFVSLVQVVVTSNFAKTDRIIKARRIDLWCRWLFPIGFVLIMLETLIFRIVL